jgi:hypothetical protein
MTLEKYFGGASEFRNESLPHVYVERLTRNGRADLVAVHHTTQQIHHTADRGGVS